MRSPPSLTFRRPHCAGAALRRSSVACLITLWLGGCGLEAFAQRSVTVQPIRTTASQIQVAWQARSVVPLPGLQIFPDYQLHTSANLTNWIPTGDRLAGSVGGTNRTFSVVRDVTVGRMAFFQVESLVELPGADLIGANLAEGDFSGANLFGADLFAANLHDVNLHGADLDGADLRFAILTNADLGGASLFAAKLLSADLSLADLKKADLSFA